MLKNEQAIYITTLINFRVNKKITKKTLKYYYCNQVKK
tara:strand:+ start:371 stop:484 length:114 start_codon:yes stop_codon:yes gene_type:complete